ncbi:hypothetical protein D3C72_2366600 [compost metagenome]
MANKTGVVKLFPVAIAVPPEATVNHSCVPTGDVTVNVAVLPAQILTGATVGADGVAAATTVTLPTSFGQPTVLSATLTE